MQDPPLYNPLEEKVKRLEGQVNRLLQDYRIGQTLTGPFPVSESHMGLRRANGVNYYVAGVVTPPTTSSTSAFGANFLHTVPFYVASPVFADRLAFYVAGAVAGTGRIGIYESNANLYPTKLIVDAGAVSLSGVAWRTIDFPKVRLRRGLNWIAYVANVSSTLNIVSPADSWEVLGRTLSATAYLSGWYKAFTYAVLPAMFPTGGAAVQTTPLVLVRLL